jgi:predicted transcriptional regulator
MAVLDAAGSGSTKTRIMYSANLSFKLLEKYLNEALDLGFLENNDSSYFLTEKGRAQLIAYHDFYKRFAKAERVFENLIGEREILKQMCKTSIAPVMVETVQVKVKRHKKIMK